MRGKSFERKQFQDQQLHILTTNFKKIKYEDLLKITNKPDPAILATSYLSNEIKKGPKSRETIPLSNHTIADQCRNPMVYFYLSISMWLIQYKILF
jgi:hypothetical protein